MSPDKRADLDAELAALEAELAQLEARKKAPKPAPKPEAAAVKPEEPKAKRGFGFGKKKDEISAPAPPAAPAPVSVPVVVAPSPQPEARVPSLPRTDGSQWREENGAWVRSVARPKRVVRRILDENDAVVREEPAGARDIDEVGAVKAERGVGRLFRRKKDV